MGFIPNQPDIRTNTFTQTNDNASKNIRVNDAIPDSIQSLALGMPKATKSE